MAMIAKASVMTYVQFDQIGVGIGKYTVSCTVIWLWEVPVVKSSGKGQNSVLWEEIGLV